MSDSNRPYVLVVDDDPALQQLITSLLTRARMTAQSAINVTQAREILTQDPLPDIILLDLMLPEINGIDYLQEMRADNRLANIPVIILSALADPDQIREGLDHGAQRYLTKPYLAKNLIRTIDEVLEETAS